MLVLRLRAAAADYNARVVAFAAANGISNYPNRGVRTRSQNGRGVRNTVHTEPFFNDDLAMSQAIRNNPSEFAAIYQESFGNIDATLIPPHGVGRDRGAASSVFGDETSFGELMVDQIQGGAADAGSGLGDVPVDDPIAGDGFTDFGGDLNQEEYLSNQNAADPDLQGSPADIERFVIPAAIENTLKEIICGLAGGGGLKLPNKQICINHAINALLGQIAGIASQALQGAIGALAGAFQNFMSHLNLDAVLGRINGVLGQISNLANMINFCSAPVDPIQIPNVLQNAMGSFLGKGMEIMNKIGSIPTPNIGGCTAGGFNPGIFDGGVLKTIGDNLDDLSLVEDIILADIEEIVTDIEDLIADETDVPTEYSSGGSDFLEGDRPVWDGVSVLFNAQDEGIAGATRNGSALWSAYQQLGSYQVKDLDGNVYNNIFELFVDDDLLRLLRRTPNPQPDIIEREPILNYCGETVGFREIVKQRAPQRSRGTPPATQSDQPGFNAGGLPTNPLTTAINELATAGGGTVNNNITINNANNATGFNGTISTVDNTATEVLFGGVRRTPGADKSWFFTITAVANRTNGADATAIKLEGLFDNNSGTVTIVGTAGNKTTYNSTPATSNYDLLVDVVGNEVRVRVQGDSSHNVDWRVRYEYIEA
jgi:hypothetical protein